MCNLPKYDTINFVSRYPGSGKDTVQASVFNALIESGQKVQQFGTGNAIRWHKSNNTALGIEASKYSPTQLLPFALMRQIIDEYLATLDLEGKLLVNGFPRSEEQIPLYEATMANFKRSDIAVYLDVSREEADRRMEKRNERPEDRVASERAMRLDEADLTIGPVISYFDDSGKLKRINGMQAREKVIADTLQGLKELGILVPDHANA